jgi:acyl-CoA synthetase (AMP-forming)/AMP-acid ligase II/acyl carrier protein
VKSQNLVELLSGRAQQFGDKKAFGFVRTQDGDGASVTYGQLHAQAMAIAAELQTRTRPGDRAWLLFPPGLESTAAFFGCLYAGVVAVPLSPPRVRRLSGSLKAVLDASEPALVLTSSEHLEQAENLYGELPQLQRLPWLATDEVPEDLSERWRAPDIRQGDLAFLQYTSGSTAAPKGVMVSHGNLLHNSSQIREAFGTAEDDTAVFWLPLYHDMGLIGGVIQPIYCGGTCVLLAPAAFLQRPRLWLETISTNRAAISGGPDFAYDVCARKIGPEERGGLDLSCWRIAFTGAEPIRAGTLSRFASAFADCGFRRTAFLPVYGLAEATLMVSGGPRGNPPTVVRVDATTLSEHRIREAAEPQSSARDLVGSGVCLPGQDVVIVDPNTSCPCDDDAVGEIWIRGASVAQGYFRQSEATEATFHGFLADTRQGPYLRTGDLGFIRSGQLFVTGRLKDLIIIRGRNYYPEDIEVTVEAAHPSFRVGHCVAFSAEIEEQERLIVVQEIEPRQRSVDGPAAFQEIRQAISSVYELEAHSIVLAKAGAIPKTTSGKRRRAACRDLFLQGGLDMHASWTANGRNGHSHPMLSGHREPLCQPTAKEIEAWLVQRMARQLSMATSQIRLEKPFLELGMGSLDAMEITADLEGWLKRPLSPTAIYNYPNITSLANWLATSASDPQVPEAPPTHKTGAIDSVQLIGEIQQMSQEEIEASIVRELRNQRR